MLGVLVGLKAEARIAARLGAVAISGARPELAASGAKGLIAAGATELLSFGLAGGLALGLEPGDLVIATAVLIGETRHPTDPGLTNRLAGALPEAHLGAVIGSDAAIADAAAKRALNVATGALAVDMESQAIAVAGLPFAVLRAIADPANRALPPAALVGLRPDGGADLAAVLASLLKAPGQLPRLVGVARESRAALRALARAASRLM